jgi:putative hydrolase of the HAD superfamily
MVGDRIDNDIAPANLLGITSILLRTGRHRNQAPRTWEEVPHITVKDIDALGKELTTLFG